MTTLSEDGDSWKANGIKRRDFRDAKDGPEVPKHGSRKKKLKDWCRGKVGKKHDYQLMTEHWSTSLGTVSWSGRPVPKVYRCTDCRKQEWGEATVNKYNQTH